MTDESNPDDPAEPTFGDLLDDLVEIGEEAIEDIRQGIEDADRDHPLEPESPFERIQRRMERLREQARESSARDADEDEQEDEVEFDLEDELEVETEPEFIFGEDGWDSPPADARYCPHCAEPLAGHNVHFIADELLGRYRAQFRCPDCRYHGEVIRHDVESG